MAITKLIAGVNAQDPNASTGEDVATAVNGLIDAVKTISSVQDIGTAAAVGGSYFVVAGVYDLSSAPIINIDNDLSIFGGENCTFISGNRSMFRPRNGNLYISGLNFTHSGNGTDNSIVNLDSVAMNGISVRIEKCKSNGVQYVVFASDEKPHNFTVESVTVSDCIFINSVQAAYKVAGVKCKKQVIERNIIDGGNRAGIQAGFVKDDGGGISLGDIENITISSNRITNIKPATVGAGGSNAIRAEGFGATIAGNLIEDCFSLAGSGPSNVEAIYTKTVSAKIDGNTIRNITANQGAITIKGGGRAATTTASAGHKYFVTNNTIFNSSKTGEFVNSVGIYIQASDVFLNNNHIENMASRSISTGGVSADLLSNISIMNTMIVGASSFILIDFVAKIQDVFIDNLMVDGIDRSADASVIRISPPTGQSISRVKIFNVSLFGAATGAGRYNLLQVASAQNTSDVEVRFCKGDLMKRLIRKDDAGVLNNFTISDCDLSTPSNVVEVFGGTITNAWTRDNKGWMERTGTINLGSVAANTKTSVYIGSIEDASLGDYAQFALNLPVAIQCEARAAGSGINFLLENTSAASVDLTATAGVIWVEKRYSSLS